jgi:peptidoglycan/xylan/chitin deacetylase (PgdA/CDA1 family)
MDNGSTNEERPPAVVHVDLDGAPDIYKGHGWVYPYEDDPIFESGLSNILELLAGNGIKATLFAIASGLDDPRKLKMLKAAVRQGHEVASHSLSHAYLRYLDAGSKRREIGESRDKLEKLLGVEVRGFRAPGYQIDRESLQILAQCGYQYDSSVIPTRNFSRRVQIPVDRLRTPQRPIDGCDLLELPLPDFRPFPFPCNASYVLLFGQRGLRWAVKRLKKRGTPLVLLFHLIDLAEPMPKERLNGWRGKVFTLSNVSIERKRSECQRMVDLMREHYRVITTRELVNCYRSSQDLPS